MSVRNKIIEPNGVFFISFTCARWLPLFELTDGYDAVYNWFNHLKQQNHHIVAYVIMPSHIHVMIAFRTSQKKIHTIVGNGKRFMAYDLVKKLAAKGHQNLLNEMASWVNATDRLENKLHQVFEPSFDRKDCYSIRFMEQKANYIHLNPCKAGLAKIPEEYIHSSAKYYYTGEQGVYPVITYMELQDIDLSL